MEASHQSPELLQAFIEDLVSLNEYRHKRVLETYFFPDVIYSSTLITTTGILNVRRVFHTWAALNKDEPFIENVIFDGQTCVIHLRQNLRPRIFPLLHLQVPAMTTLHFRADDNGIEGFYKVWKQEENWTLEGLLQSVPLLSWWYEKVVRVIMGKVVTNTGDFLYAATQTANRISNRSRELHITTNEISKQVGDRVHQYREDLQTNLENKVTIMKHTLEEKAGTVETVGIAAIENGNSDGYIPEREDIEGEAMRILAENGTIAIDGAETFADAVKEEGLDADVVKEDGAIHATEN